MSVLMNIINGIMPFIKNHFSYVLMAIIIIFLLPGVIAFIKENRKTRRNAENDENNIFNAEI
ncbi:hypothetical protein G9F73_013185 [Clostridium estertheticum]|uniref:hypothetical protein n=1 Tax=Clostridium estertheticum TaxID=238834 RepID=UPI0013EEB710|nr:hypothetical protein [Clostridium estertheticum]MBZ9608763.1 hypothetical protein [Clostridium estertheticum]